MSQIIQNLKDNMGCATFVFNGKTCGVEPETVDSKLKYYAWCGESEKYFNSIDELKNAKFYDGLTLIEVEPLVKIEYC